jgi:cystathionine beta-lyase
VSDAAKPRGAATRLIHPTPPPTSPSRTVGPAIQRGSTVLMDRAASLYDDDQVTYGRGGLAAQQALCAALMDLEGAEGCQLFPSGVAAVTGAMLAVLKAGDAILVADSVYAPTRRFCDTVLTRFGVTVGYYPPRAEPEAIFAQGGPTPRLVVLESPGSLTFEFQDVPEIARLARERGVLTLLDNTWAAGLLFKPLACGVDLSVQALTKYACGHSDVFMGSVCASRPAMIEALAAAAQSFGWAVSPDDAYQILRGLRTMPTRLKQHGETALALAEWLRQQPEVLEVLHPGLPASPDHDLWRRDFSGASGLFGAVLKPAPRRTVEAMLDSLTLFGLGFSWGGFESLAIHCDPQLGKRRHRPSFGGPLVRFHAGLEDPADLIDDLRRGLDAFSAAP